MDLKSEDFEEDEVEKEEDALPTGIEVQAESFDEQSMLWRGFWASYCLKRE